MNSKVVSDPKQARITSVEESHDKFLLRVTYKNSTVSQALSNEGKPSGSQAISSTTVFNHPEPKLVKIRERLIDSPFKHFQCRDKHIKSGSSDEDEENNPLVIDVETVPPETSIDQIRFCEPTSKKQPIGSQVVSSLSILKHPEPKLVRQQFLITQVKYKDSTISQEQTNKGQPSGSQTVTSIPAVTSSEPKLVNTGERLFDTHVAYKKLKVSHEQINEEQPSSSEAVLSIPVLKPEAKVINIGERFTDSRVAHKNASVFEEQTNVGQQRGLQAALSIPVLKPEAKVVNIGERLTDSRVAYKKLKVSNDQTNEGQLSGSQSVFSIPVLKPEAKVVNIGERLADSSVTYKISTVSQEQDNDGQASGSQAVTSFLGFKPLEPKLVFARELFLHAKVTYKNSTVSQEKTIEEQPSGSQAVTSLDIFKAPEPKSGCSRELFSNAQVTYKNSTVTQEQTNKIRPSGSQAVISPALKSPEAELVNSRARLVDSRLRLVQCLEKQILPKNFAKDVKNYPLKNIVSREPNINIQPEILENQNDRLQIGVNKVYSTKADLSVQPRVEKKISDQPRVVEKDRSDQPRVVEKDQSDQPRVVEKDRSDQPQVVEKDRSDQPRVVEKDRSDQPLVVEKDRSDQPLVVEKDRIDQPLVVEKDRSDQPLVVEKDRSDQPRVVEKDRSDQPRVVEKNRSDQPRVVEKNRSDQPRVVEKDRSDQPRVVEKDRSDQPRVVEKDRSDQPRVVEKDRSDQPRVVGKGRSDQPRVVEKDFSDQPRVVEEDLSDQSRVVEEDPSDQSRVVEEDLSDQPRVVEEDLSDQPRVVEEDLSDQPRVVEEDLSDQPRVVAEDLSDQPRVVEEDLSDQPRVVKEDLSDKPRFEEDLNKQLQVDKGPIDQPRVDKDLIDKNKVDEDLIDKPKVDEDLSVKPAEDLSGQRHVDKNQSGQPQVDENLTGQQQVHEVPIGKPQEDDKLGSQQQVHEVPIGKPQEDDKLGSQQQVHEVVTDQPQVYGNLSGSTQVDKDLTVQIHEEKDLTDQPQVNHCLTDQPQLNQCLTDQPQVNDGLTVQPQVNDGLTVQPQVNDGLTDQQQVNDGLTDQQQVNDGLTDQQQVNDGLTDQQQVNDGLTDQQQVNDGLTDQQQVNDGLTDQQQVNDGLTDQQQVNDGLTDQQQVNDGLTDQQQVNDGLTDQQQVNDGLTDQQQVNDGLTDQQQVNDGLTDQQQVNDGLTDQQQYNEGLTGEGQLNDNLTDSKNVDEDLTNQPQVNVALTSHTQLDKDLIGLPQVDVNITCQPQKIEDLTDQQQMNEDLFGQPQVDKGLFCQPQIDEDLTGQQQIDQGLAGQQQVNDDITEQQQVNDYIIEQQQVNDDITEQQQVNDDITEQQQANDDITEQPQVNDDITEQPQVNDDITERPQVNDDLTEKPQVNDDLTEQPQIIVDSSVQPNFIKSVDVDDNLQRKVQNSVTEIHSEAHCFQKAQTMEIEHVNLQCEEKEFESESKNTTEEIVNLSHVVKSNSSVQEIVPNAESNTEGSIDVGKIPEPQPTDASSKIKPPNLHSNPCSPSKSPRKRKVTETHVDEDGFEVDQEFTWDEYLEETGSTAVPPTAFLHVEYSLESGIKVGMALEVPNREEDAYWQATVVMNCSPLLSLRYLGYGDDRTNDFWWDISSSDTHPVGWSSKNNKKICPPEGVLKNNPDYMPLLNHNLEPVPAYLLDGKNSNIPIDQIKTSMRVEVLEELYPTNVWVATIVENVGGRLLLRYVGDESGAKDFWLFYLSYRIHPVSWAKENDQSLVYKPPEDIKTQHTDDEWILIREKLLIVNDDNPTLPEDILQPQEFIEEHNFEEGMKLEAIHPIGRQFLHPATVFRVTNSRFFLVEIDDYRIDMGPPCVICCHAASPNIFRVNWGQENGIKIRYPRGYLDNPGNKEFDWDEYLIFCNAKPAPAELFLETYINSGFDVNAKLEAASPFQPNQICAATIMRLTEPLLWLQLEGIDPTFNPAIFVLNSQEIFPVGWCESNNYPLKPPRFNYSKRQRKMLKRIGSSTQESLKFSNPLIDSSLGLKENSKSWCSKIYFNHKCFSGPFLSKNRLAQLPRHIGPGPVALVMKEVLSSLINVAYISSRVLRVLQLRGKFNPNMNQEVLKAKWKGKSYRAVVEVVTKSEQVEEFCKEICRKIDCCTYLFGPKFIENTCPEQCQNLSKTKYSQGSLVKKRKNNRQNGNNSQKKGNKKFNYPELTSNEQVVNAELDPVTQPKDREDCSPKSTEDAEKKPVKTKYKSFTLPKSSMVTRGAKLPNFSLEMKWRRQRVRKLTSPTTNNSTPRRGRPPLSLTALNNKSHCPEQASIIDTSDSDGNAPKVIEISPSNVIRMSNPHWIRSNEQDLVAKLLVKPKQIKRPIPRVSLPSNPIKWTVDEVVKFVQSTDCAPIAPALKKEEIDGQALLLMTLPAAQEFLHLKYAPAVKFCHLVEVIKLAFYLQFANLNVEGT